MSLILDALKKSEAQRQLGQAPTLGSPIVPLRRRRPLLPFVLIAIALIALGGVWYLQKRAHAKAHALAAAAAAKPGASAVASAATARAAPAPVAATPAMTPAATPGRAANSAANASVASTAAAPAATPTVPAAAPVVAAKPAPQAPLAFGARRPGPTSARTASATPAPVATHPAPAAAATTTTATTAKTEPPASIAPPPAAAASNSAGKAAVAAAPTPAAAPPAEERTVQAYYELPFPVRKDLPAIKISMHVYATDPAQRFVVINGTHEGQGDSIDGGVTVVEIRPSDVVLAFQGQTFTVPRTGI